MGIRSRSKAAHATGNVASSGFGGGDTQPSNASGTGLVDDDVDIESERVEQVKQAFQRILAKVAAQQARHVGFREAE